MITVGIAGFRFWVVVAVVATCGLLGVSAAMLADVERPGLPAIGAPEPTVIEPVGVLLYVSPAGNDNWSGKLPEPNAAKTDGPLATLHRARDELRKLKAGGGLPNGATVLIRAGTYCFNQPLRLGKEDSGTAAGPILFRPYGEEKPVVIGGGGVGQFVSDKGGMLEGGIV